MAHGHPIVYSSEEAKVQGYLSQNMCPDTAMQLHVCDCAVCTARNLSKLMDCNCLPDRDPCAFCVTQLEQNEMIF